MTFIYALYKLKSSNFYCISNWIVFPYLTLGVSIPLGVHEAMGWQQSLPLKSCEQLGFIKITKLETRSVGFQFQYSFTQICSQFPMSQRHFSVFFHALTWSAEANDEIMTAAVSWVPSSSRILRVGCVSTFGDLFNPASGIPKLINLTWKFGRFRILRHLPVVSEIYGKYIESWFALRTRLASSEFCASKFAKQLAKQANVVRVCKTFWVCIVPCNLSMSAYCYWFESSLTMRGVWPWIMNHQPELLHEKMINFASKMSFVPTLALQVWPVLIQILRRSKVARGAWSGCQMTLTRVTLQTCFPQYHIKYYI